jgi:hypothetical protein
MYIGINIPGAGGESASWGLSDAQQTLSAFIADRVIVFSTKKLPVVD